MKASKFHLKKGKKKKEEVNYCYFVEATVLVLLSILLVNHFPTTLQKEALSPDDIF